MKLAWFALFVTLPGMVVSHEATRLRIHVEEVTASTPAVDNLDGSIEVVNEAEARELLKRKVIKVQRRIFPKFKFTRFPTRDPTSYPVEATIRPTSSSGYELQCGEYGNSKSVMAMFEVSSSNWGKCKTHLSSVHSSTSKISTGMRTVKTTLKIIASLTERLKLTSASVHSAASATVAKLKSIPKVGKVIKAFLDVLKKAKELLEKVDKRVDSVKKFFDKLSSAFKQMEQTFRGMVQAAGAAEMGYNLAASVTRTAIDCTGKTETCTDESIVEAHNKRNRASITFQHIASGVCPRTFEAIARKLRTLADAIKDSVFQAVKKAVEGLAKALKPLFDAIKKIMDEIKKHLGEVYCCTTPFVIQAGLKFLSQVMDLATCPVDGLQNGVQAAMEEVEKEMNNMLNSVIKKVLAPVPNVAVRQPEIRPGKVEAENCTFELPDASTRTVYPFKPWLDALSSDKPSTAMFAHSAAAFGNEIRDTCREAANEIGKGLAKDCCLNYRPLRDGQFCDPTSSVPYKKCTQCESGKHSFWLNKFHHACGKTPCGKDGTLCGKLTSCKNCCNGSSYWYKKAFTACGREPCWRDGTVCGKLTTCNACCNKATWWSRKFFTACGREPCLGRGKRCLAGTTCKRCCKGSKWIWGKFGHFCK